MTAWASAPIQIQLAGSGTVRARSREVETKYSSKALYELHRLEAEPRVDFSLVDMSRHSRHVVAGLRSRNLIQQPPMRGGTLQVMPVVAHAVNNSAIMLADTAEDANQRT
jgi:hypothetical protein